MPPRASLTSSFSVTDANNEVVCPLKNNDGSNCRKRCLGVSLPCFIYLYLSLSSFPPSLIAASSLGKTLPLHAGAYPARASQPLHPQAPCHRRELPVDGEHSSRPARPGLASRSSTVETSSWFVLFLFLFFFFFAFSFFLFFFLFLTFPSLPPLVPILPPSSPPIPHHRYHLRHHMCPTGISC